MFGRVLVVGVAAIMSVTAALAQEREWSWGVSETEAFLVFGVPESEDVGISFWCPQGNDEIRIFIADANVKLAPDIDTKIEFDAGDKEFSIAARTMLNELDATTSAEGAVPATDPLFPALQAVDRFNITVSGESQTFPSAGQDFANLVEACKNR